MPFDFAPSMKQVFSRTIAEQGEGSLLAMKIALQAFEGSKILLVFSRGSLSENARYAGRSALVAENPLAAARGLARASKEKVLVFAGDVITQKLLKHMKGVRENITYICLNNGGSLSAGAGSLERQNAGLVSAKYAATASVAFPEDYIKKLEKAKEDGFAFIEVHCPSPRLWGYDPSNTIEIARVAVNSNFWPLLEYTPEAKATYVPEQLESADTYARMQARFRENDIEKIRARTSENEGLLAA